MNRRGKPQEEFDHALTIGHAYLKLENGHHTRNCTAHTLFRNQLEAEMNGSVAE